jgi:peptidoglycan/LPS O-acetylase OafA/YrhL
MARGCESIATSAVLYYLIERPFQASGKRGSGQRASSAKGWSRNPVAALGAWAVQQFAFLAAVS